MVPGVSLSQLNSVSGPFQMGEKPAPAESSSREYCLTGAPPASNGGSQRTRKLCAWMRPLTLGRAGAAGRSAVVDKVVSSDHLDRPSSVCACNCNEINNQIHFTPCNRGNVKKGTSGPAPFPLRFTVNSIHHVLIGLTVAGQQGVQNFRS